MPLPHFWLVVLVDVLELVLVVEVPIGCVELLDVVTGEEVLVEEFTGADVLVELEVDGADVLVDVVVGVTMHGSIVRWTRSDLISFAKNAPFSCAPCVISSFEFGAQRIAVTCALREMRTSPPAKMWMSHASSDGVSGPIVLPFSIRIAPITLMVTGPRARRRALRPSFKLQNV
jgi:hypothetical protein